MKTFVDIEAGVEKGELMVMMARQTGKSSYYFPPPKNVQFQKVEEAIVDGEKWYCVRTRSGSEADNWLRKQNCAVETSTSWSPASYFDVPDKIYMMLVLRFQ